MGPMQRHQRVNAFAEKPIFIDRLFAAMVRLVKQEKDIPCAVGFGISTPEQAGKMAALSDGAIVGSAIVKLIERHGTRAPSYVGDYVRAMKEAVRKGGNP